MREILKKLTRKQIIMIISSLVLITGVIITSVFLLNKDTKEEIKKCLVEFETNGGTSIESQEIECGSTIKEPNIKPEKTGFEFIGWYLNEIEFDFNKKIDENIILQAKFEALPDIKTVTVSFQSNGGTNVNSIELLSGTSIFEPLKPTLKNHTFLGWYLNDELFDFNTKINENITLVAKWKENKNNQSQGGNTGGNTKPNGGSNGNQENNPSPIVPDNPKPSEPIEEEKPIPEGPKYINKIVPETNNILFGIDDLKKYGQYYNQTVYIKVKVYPNAGDDHLVVKSSNLDVVTIDWCTRVDISNKDYEVYSVIINIKEIGEADLILGSNHDPNVKEVIHLSVVRYTVPVTGFKISDTEMTLRVGETGSLTVYIYPENTTQKVNFGRSLGGRSIEATKIEHEKSHYRMYFTAKEVGTTYVEFYEYASWTTYKAVVNVIE